MWATSVFFAYDETAFCWCLSFDFHRVCDTQNKTFERSPFLQECTPVLLCRDYGNARMTETVLKQVFFERASPGKVFPEMVYSVIG